MPTFTPNLKYDNIMEYRLSSHSGDLFFELKENKPEKKYSLEEKRQEYGNAYLPWEKEADEYLIRLYEEGKSIKELTEIFERNNGAIRSRLKKLGKL